MTQGWSRRFPNSRVFRQPMDYIATETEQASVLCNGSLKMWTLGEGHVDRWQAGKASVDEAVTVCRKIIPCADL